MSKDWFIWALCLCLFGSGVIFSKVVPGEFGLTDFIGILSAFGTLAAAVAAWQSAKISAQMAAGSRNSERLISLAEHRKQFDEMLTQTECDLGVVFHDRITLYDRVFPTNRSPLLQFEMEGDVVRLEEWKKSYFTVIEYLRYPGELLIDRWVFAVMHLASELCMRNVSVETEQVYVSGYTPSGFNEENVSRYMNNLCSVIGRISKFGMIDAKLHRMAESTRFEKAFEAFVIKVKRGVTPHSFRSTSKSTI